MDFYNRTTLTGDQCNFLRVLPHLLNAYGQNEEIAFRILVMIKYLNIFLLIRIPI